MERQKFTGPNVLPEFSEFVRQLAANDAATHVSIECSAAIRNRARELGGLFPNLSTQEQSTALWLSAAYDSLVLKSSETDSFAKLLRTASFVQAVALARLNPGVPLCPVDFAGGLLCDIGQQLMRRVFADEYPTLLETGRQSGRRDVDIEESAYGFSHVDVGCAFLKERSLDDLHESLRCHHFSLSEIRSGETSGTAARAFLATHIRDLILGQAAPNAGLSVDNIAKSLLNMDSRQLLEQVLDDLRQHASALGIDEMEWPTADAILNLANHSLAELITRESLVRQPGSSARMLKAALASDLATGAIPNEQFAERGLKFLQQPEPAAALVRIRLANSEDIARQYGAAAPAALMRYVARLAYDDLRDRDLVARRDAGEVVLLLHLSEIQHLQFVLDRFQRTLGEHRVVNFRDQSIPLRTVMGAVGFVPNHATPELFDFLNSLAEQQLESARLAGLGFETTWLPEPLNESMPETLGSIGHSAR